MHHIQDISVSLPLSTSRVRNQRRRRGRSAERSPIALPAAHAGPSTVPVCAHQRFRHYSGNRHRSAHSHADWLISSVPSDFAGTMAGSRHYSNRHYKEHRYRPRSFHRREQANARATKNSMKLPLRSWTTRKVVEALVKPALILACAGNESATVDERDIRRDPITRPDAVFFYERAGRRVTR